MLHNSRLFQYLLYLLSVRRDEGPTSRGSLRVNNAVQNVLLPLQAVTFDTPSVTLTVTGLSWATRIGWCVLEEAG